MNEFDAAVMKSIWNKVKDILDKLTCEACKVSVFVINQNTVHTNIFSAALVEFSFDRKIFLPNFEKAIGKVLTIKICLLLWCMRLVLLSHTSKFHAYREYICSFCHRFS